MSRTTLVVVGLLAAISVTFFAVYLLGLLALVLNVLLVLSVPFVGLALLRSAQRGERPTWVPRYDSPLDVAAQHAAVALVTTVLLLGAVAAHSRFAMFVLGALSVASWVVAFLRVRSWNAGDKVLGVYRSRQQAPVLDIEDVKAEAPRPDWMTA